MHVFICMFKMFCAVNKVLFLITCKAVRASSSYLESLIIDFVYLLLVVLSKKDISYDQEMYCRFLFIN